MKGFFSDAESGYAYLTDPDWSCKPYHGEKEKCFFFSAAAEK